MALTMRACSAGATADGRSAPPVNIPHAEASAGDAPPSQPATDAAVCLQRASGPRCDGALGVDELKALSDAIDAAHDAVIRSSFADVHAIIDLARLQLYTDISLPG